LDLNQDKSPLTGYYLPPADVPPEGAVVKLGCEVMSPFTNRWERSPDFEIKVVRRTAPMEFFFGNEPGYPSTATMKPGEKIRFAVSIRPYPASQPIPAYEIVAPAGYSGNTGDVLMEPVSDWTWRCYYTAPVQVPAPMEVKLRFRAFDPWIQQEQQIDYTIQLQP